MLVSALVASIGCNGVFCSPPQLLSRVAVGYFSRGEEFLTHLGGDLLNIAVHRGYLFRAAKGAPFYVVLGHLGFRLSTQSPV